MASEELRRACAAELSRRHVVVDGLTTEGDRGGQWAVMVTAQGRTFHFGTLGRERFFFVEIVPNREVDLTLALPPPAQHPAVLWPYAFWLLGEPLAAPSARGPSRPVL